MTTPSFSQTGLASAGAHDPCAAGAQDAGILRDDAAWRLEPHICRACMARLVSRPLDDQGWRRYECTNCGLQGEGSHAGTLCCCGMTIRRPVKGGGSGKVSVDAGVRCIPNPSPSPEMPSLYVASDS